MGNYKSYEEAYRKGSFDVWACGKIGRRRECGRIHDFYYTLGDGSIVHDFRCWHNYYYGCPKNPKTYSLKEAKKRFPMRF